MRLIIYCIVLSSSSITASAFTSYGEAVRQMICCIISCIVLSSSSETASAFLSYGEAVRQMIKIAHQLEDLLWMQLKFDDCLSVMFVGGPTGW